MDQNTVIERLNDLLELETRGMSERSREAQPFVDWEAAAAVPVFDQIVAEEREHQRWLTEFIVQLDGIPRPPIRDMRSARVHYLGLRYLMPLVIDDERRRIAAYERAAADSAALGSAARLVERILTRHRSHLERLEALAERLTPDEAEPAASATQGDDA